jgi:hypothetical protein
MTGEDPNLQILGAKALRKFQERMRNEETHL